jgi:hypothetical protein
VGLVGSLGLTLGNVLKLQAQSAGPKARAHCWRRLNIAGRSEP